MALLVPVCETDDTITGGLTFTNNGQVRCDGPGATLAWQQFDYEDMSPVMQPLDTADGLLITGAILLTWTIGYIGRLFIKTVIGSRWL